MNKHLRKFSVLLIAAAALSAAACSGGDEPEIQETVASTTSETTVTQQETEAEISETTEEEERQSVVLILGISAADKTAYLEDLCGKYNMSVVYDYQNFAMAAVQTPELTDEELEEFMETLRGEDEIISVERDGVVYLDDAPADGYSVQ